MTVVLGEMDVVRMKPTNLARLAPVHPASFPHPTGQRRSPTSGGRLEVLNIPGGQRPPGPDCKGRCGTGDESLREQKEEIGFPFPCFGSGWLYSVEVWYAACDSPAMCVTKVMGAATCTPLLSPAFHPRPFLPYKASDRPAVQVCHWRLGCFTCHFARRSYDFIMPCICGNILARFISLKFSSPSGP